MSHYHESYQTAAFPLPRLLLMYEGVEKTLVPTTTSSETSYCLSLDLNFQTAHFFFSVSGCYRGKYCVNLLPLNTRHILAAF